MLDVRHCSSLGSVVSWKKIDFPFPLLSLSFPSPLLLTSAALLLLVLLRPCVSNKWGVAIVITTAAHTVLI